MERQWFSSTNYSVVEITEYASLSKQENVLHSMVIKNSAIVQSLMERIQQIDPNGDMMVSWGPDAQYMTLTFKNETTQDVILIIQQRFKTPSTGFHGRNEKEAALYSDIRDFLDKNIAD